MRQSLRRRQCVVLETLENRWLLSAYYFASEGNDVTGLGTQASPWATLDKANTLDLNAGDSVNLKGGQTFSGAMTLDATDAGSATTPVTITSYGTGRATISTASTSSDSIYV